MISCSNHLTNILTFLILHSLFHESNLPLICNLDESRYYNIFNSSLSSEEEMDFFFNFLAILRGMSELSSLTRNPTQVPWSGSMESQPLDFQGLSWDNIFLISIFSSYMCVHAQSKLCPTLCDPPGSSDHGIL